MTPTAARPEGGWWWRQLQLGRRAADEGGWCHGLSPPVRSRLSAPRRHEPSEPPRAVRSATIRHGASTLLFLSSLGTLVRPVIFPRENNQKCVPYPERNEHHVACVRGALRTSRKPLGFFSKLYLVNSVRGRKCRMHNSDQQRSS
jgi:hypothetical protein